MVCKLIRRAHCKLLESNVCINSLNYDILYGTYTNWLNSHIGEKPTTLFQGCVKSDHHQEEVSKKELKARVRNGSLVARRALSQWNKLNTTIRGIVGTTEVSL